MRWRVRRRLVRGLGRGLWGRLWVLDFGSSKVTRGRRRVTFFRGGADDCFGGHGGYSIMRACFNAQIGFPQSNLSEHKFASSRDL